MGGKGIRFGAYNSGTDLQGKVCFNIVAYMPRSLSARPAGSRYLCFWFLIPVVCSTPFVEIVVFTLVNLQGMNLRGHPAEICLYKKQYALLLTLTCCVFSRQNGY